MKTNKISTLVLNHGWARRKASKQQLRDAADLGRETGHEQTQYVLAELDSRK